MNKVFLSTIRKANKKLILTGISDDIRNNYTGIITAKTISNGIVKVREINKEKINEAYAKSLKEYIKNDKKRS